MDWPEFVTTEEIQRRLPVPITKAVVMVLLGSVAGGRIYRREDGGWRLLDDKVYTGDNPPPWKHR